MTPATTVAAASPWPHRLALLLVATTFPLIWVGGLVTSMDAGMAFRDWLTSDGYFMLVYPWWQSAGEKFVEHGHRLLGALVGAVTILLLAGLFRWERRGWVRGFGIVLLLAVIGQGVLGGMRVVLDQRLLAMIHGCTGPLFFALTVAMAVVTSRRWRDTTAGHELAEQSEKGHAGRMRRLAQVAAALTLLAYLQLVLGARLRHIPVTATPDAFRAAVHLHLGTAALVLLGTVGLGISVWRLARRDVWITRLYGGLAALVVMQLLLGAATWLVKFGVPHWASDLWVPPENALAAQGQLQTTITTAHVALGSAILAVALALAMRAARRSRMAPPTTLAHPTQDARLAPGWKGVTV